MLNIDVRWQKVVKGRWNCYKFAINLYRIVRDSGGVWATTQTRDRAAPSHGTAPGAGAALAAHR